MKLKSLKGSFGSNYNNDNGYQIYARDTLNPHNSFFYFDVKSSNDMVSTITAKTDNFSLFEGKMEMDFKDMIYPKNCKEGNCKDGIGSKYFSDGYLFIGQWRKFKPEFGPVYNRDKVALYFIDKRLSADELREKNIVDHNKNVRATMETLNSLDVNINSFLDRYNSHVTLMEKYYGFQRTDQKKMMGALNNATRYANESMALLNQIEKDSKSLASLYSTTNWCNATIPILKQMSVDVLAMKKVLNDVIKAMSNISVPDYNKDLKPLAKKLQELDSVMRKKFITVNELHNNCVKIINEDK